LAGDYEEFDTVVRGRGLLQGFACRVPEFASQVSRCAFDRGLIIETSGPESNVVKLLPPLTIDDDSLQEGLEIIAESLDVAFTALSAVEPGRDSTPVEVPA
jgi:diaminobutyrate-2-oxoglutarate transaminase